MAYKRGEHPNSLKNITDNQIKPGETRNPRGRPAGWRDPATLIRAILGLKLAKHTTLYKTFVENLPEEQQKFVATLEDGMVLGQVLSAMEGNTNAAKWLIDRAYGPQVQKVAQTTADGEDAPIKAVLVLPQPIETDEQSE